MNAITDKAADLRRVRWILSLFVVGLVLSGVTAFPLVWEVNLLLRVVGPGTLIGEWWPAMADWVLAVHRGLTATDSQYPFILYGTDWLAFAHIVIAIAFIGPLRDPVRNLWVIEFGMIACVLVIPLALICGPLRGIPGFWRMIDCLFGVVGFFPLLLARSYVKRLCQSAAECGTRNAECGT